jgi:hypothetical protein
MKDVTQTSELLTFVAKLIRDVDHSRGDDGKVSLPELIGLITTSLASLITAIMGAGEIPSEARDFTEEELDDLYYLFLTEMGWNPTDDNRDLARAYFLLIRDTYTNILLIMNTKHPMRAELA